jgi:hypothetical protein
VGTDREDGLDWGEFYHKINASKMDLKLLRTQHYVFTDVPLLLEKLKVPPASQPLVDEVFGTLSGGKVEKATNEIMVGIMDLLFKNDSKALRNLGRNFDIKVLQSDLDKHS